MAGCRVGCDENYDIVEVIGRKGLALPVEQKMNFGLLVKG